MPLQSYPPPTGSAQAPSWSLFLIPQSTKQLESVYWALGRHPKAHGFLEVPLAKTDNPFHPTLKAASPIHHRLLSLSLAKCDGVPVLLSLSHWAMVGRHQPPQELGARPASNLAVTPTLLTSIFQSVFKLLSARNHCLLLCKCVFKRGKQSKSEKVPHHTTRANALSLASASSVLRFHVVHSPC